MKFTRLLPLISSLSVLALVAACARHDSGKSGGTPKMSEQTMLQQAQKAVRLSFGDQNLFDPKDMKLAADFEGADLRLISEVGRTEGSNDRAINASIVVVLKGEAEPVEATGVISAQSSAELENKDPNSKYSFSAKCTSNDCGGIVVQMSRLDDQASVALVKAGGTAAAAADANNQGEQQGETKLDPKATLDAAPANETDEQKIAREALEKEAADKTAKELADKQLVEKADTPKAVATAKMFMWFHVPLKDLKAKKEETESEKRSRLATFDMLWSTPKTAGAITSGSLHTATLALKARADGGVAKTDPVKDSSKTDVPPAPTADEAKAAADAKAADDKKAADAKAADDKKAADAKAADDKKAADAKAADDKKAADAKAAADKKVADAKAAADKKAADAKKAADKKAADEKKAREAKEKKIASVENVLTARGN